MERGLTEAGQLVKNRFVGASFVCNMTINAHAIQCSAGLHMHIFISFLYYIMFT